MTLWCLLSREWQTSPLFALKKRMLAHPLLLLYELAGGLFGIALRLQVIHEEDESNAEQNHRNRPELRGGYARYKLSSVVSANELDKETEDTVGDKVHAHIVLEIELQKQEEHQTEHYEEERRLIKLGGMNGVREVRELHAEEGIGLLAVATACKEAADSAKAVSDSDAAGYERQNVDKSAVKLVSDDEIDSKEGDDSADKAPHKCHTLAKMEARRGILDVIIHRLEERR